MPDLRWETYKKAPVDQVQCAACRQTDQTAFTDQRNFIHDVVCRYRPQRVVCLGAGLLNDIPIETLIDDDRHAVLVDWIEGVSQEGVRGSIIKDDGGTFACLFCHKSNPSRYCANYGGRASGSGRVCQAFSLMSGATLCCSNYAPGSEPMFVTHDVTAGVATHFAEQAFSIVRHSRSPRDAFRKAIDACRRPVNEGRRIPVENDSADVVTSSMIASQFESEPYRYFSILLEQKFGREEILDQEAALRALMETFRSTLFHLQMKGHTNELHRIVNKGRGRVFFSVELFQGMPNTETYFLVQEIPGVLDVLRRHFFFDFSLIGPRQALTPSTGEAGTSVIQNYVLVPKPVVDQY